MPRKSRKVRQKVGTTRTTKNFRRKRLAQPASFKKGSFRTIRIKGGKKLIVGTKKRTGKRQAQAILTPK